jgi:hypothetical protein
MYEQIAMIDVRYVHTNKLSKILRSHLFHAGQGSHGFDVDDLFESHWGDKTPLNPPAFPACPLETRQPSVVLPGNHEAVPD